MKNNLPHKLPSKPHRPIRQVARKDVRALTTNPQNKGSLLRGMIYKGPLPPPAVMEKIDDLVPGGADRIIRMAEKSQDAAIKRQDAEQQLAKQTQKDNHTENMTALWMAFFVCILFVCGGLFLVICGYEKIGASLICVTLVSVVASFLQNLKNQKKK